MPPPATGNSVSTVPTAAPTKALVIPAPALPAPQFRIAAISPSQVHAGLLATLTITGSGFLPGLSVSISGGAGASSVSLAGQNPNSAIVRVTMKTPAPYVATVRLQNPNGQAATVAIQVIR